MDFNEKTLLGRTGLKAGRLGVSSSFGAPAKAYEEAFDRGCNYFTWGTFIKGRNTEMKRAIININGKGQRDKLIISMLTYAHSAFLTEKFFVRGLKALNIEFADVLLLGYFSSRPAQRIIDGAHRLKEKGLVRFIGLTGHNRTLFSKLEEENEKVMDVFHVRYNASHRGAETDVFPLINSENSETGLRPGVVSFTATSWKKLLNPKKMPKGEKPLTPAECYRFVLSNPSVDICMMGAANLEQMKENLAVLDQQPMTEDELLRAHRIGDYIY